VKAPLTPVGSGKPLNMFTPNMWFKGNDMKIIGNTFKYSEGQALEFKGSGVTFANNDVSWNGYSGTDAPFAIKLGAGRDMTCQRNSLRYNGHALRNARNVDLLVV